MELSVSVCGQLFERMLGALAFGGTDASTNVREGGHDPYSDAKVQFTKCRSELVKRLTSQSPTLAAVDGVYFTRAVFEEVNHLTWT